MKPSLLTPTQWMRLRAAKVATSPELRDAEPPCLATELLVLDEDTPARGALWLAVLPTTMERM